MRRDALRICFVGWGAIAQRVAELLPGSADIQIVAVAVRDREKVLTNLPSGCRLVSTPDELDGLGADVVIEAAGRAAVEVWAEAALCHARAFVVCSASAFCDDALFSRLRETAKKSGAQLIIPSGALGDLGALAAASILRLDSVSHTIIKSARAWRGTNAERMVDLGSITGPVPFFTGMARETAELFPQNANVAVISAIAGLGLDHTRITLVADPGISRNCHHIVATGAFGKLEFRIENEPLADNPKSSEMTALSLVRLVKSQVNNVVC